MRGGDHDTITVLGLLAKTLIFKGADRFPDELYKNNNYNATKIVICMI